MHVPTLVLGWILLMTSVVAAINIYWYVAF
jgi:hypothetical protein